MKTEAKMPAVPYDTVAKGLLSPEGPLVLEDGSLLFSEIVGAAVKRLWPDGRITLVAHVNGAPNGLAFRPGGVLYVANQGGFSAEVLEHFPDASPDATPYRGGSIQCVDVMSGTVRTICISTVDGRPLTAPDDLVIDQNGGVYFTDIGLVPPPFPTREVPGLYYLPQAANKAQRVITALVPTNGVGLSADGRRLWWTEYETGRLMMRNVVDFGVLAEPQVRYTDCLFIHPAPATHFDSLTMMADGGVTVAVHDGTTSGKSGVMSFDKFGRPIGFHPFDDPYTTHIAFGGPDMRDAFVTLSATGRIAKLRWDTPGQSLLFKAPHAFVARGG